MRVSWSSHISEYADQAQKLCQMGFTDEKLAEFFKVSEDTILAWRLKHVEFARAVRVGKAETDNFIERCVVKGISCCFVEIEEMNAKGRPEDG